MGLFDSILGGLGSLFGGDEIDDAISQATKAQQQYYQMAVDELRRQYDQNRTDLLPWLKTGGSALSQLSQIYGLGGQPPDMSGFLTSPDYQFRLQQGQNAIDASAAARGYLDSGATRKAQIQYAGNLASGEFNNYANRLAGLAGVGQTAGTTIGGFGQNTATNLANLAVGQGNNLASSYYARGLNNANTIGNVFGYGSQAFGNLFGSGNPASMLQFFGMGG